MIQKSKLGLILLCLTLSTGCSEAIQVQPYKLTVPAHLLEPCAEPVWNGGTNGDLVEYIADLREALGKCEADKAAIRLIVDN